MIIVETGWVPTKKDSEETLHKKWVVESTTSCTDLDMFFNDEVISKKRYATGRKNFKNGGIAKWSKAVTEARKNLGITGFYAVKKGSALYKEARKIYEA